jgi:hypothetical protein
LTPFDPLDQKGERLIEEAVDRLARMDAIEDMDETVYREG